MKLKKRIIKEYSRIPIDNLADEPVYALKGITERSALTLFKVFRVESIHDLGDLEYAKSARIICEAADKGESAIDKDFSIKALNKKFRDLSPSTIAEGPVHMLSGISSKNARLLHRDLGIATIRDLADMRFIKLARNLDYKEKLIKDFENTQIADLPEAPIFALQGISVRDAGLLKKAFGLETIEDFANLKYFHWAKEFADAAEKGDFIDDEIFKERLIKKYEKYTINKIIKSPVSALQGLSTKDEEILYRAFKIKTIEKFADLKYWKWACGIMDLYVSTAGISDEVETKKTGIPLWIKILFFPVVLILLLLFFYFLNSKDLTEKIKNYFAVSEKTSNAPEDKPVNDTMKNIQPEYDNSENKSANEEFYTVLPGESLVTISEKLFGTYKKWPEIYKNNRDTINSPANLYPGQKLKIPK